jgi:virginiamycin B lyase
MKENDIPTAQAHPANLAVGPDNQIWFTELQGNKIARITTDGRAREVPVASDNGQPMDIAKGPNSTLWFTLGAGNKVGRVVVK